MTYGALRNHISMKFKPIFIHLAKDGDKNTNLCIGVPSWPIVDRHF